jgi:hypothetical protein
VDSKQILLNRIDILDAELQEARRRLEAVKIPASIVKRVGPELIDAIEGLHGKIAEARGAVAAIGTEDTPEAKSRLKTAWMKFDGLQVSGERQLSEVLALLHGARSRNATGQEGVLAEIADRLMDELSAEMQAIAWKRFTFEAEGEAFAGNTQIIRLRFPLKDIWNLPVAVHEFGHFLASQIKVPKTAERLGNALAADDDTARDKRWYYLNEFFADGAAAYALGPAYGYTCLLVRFNPVRAWSETDSIHPPDGQRAELILQMLGRMDQEPDNGKQFEGPIQRLREFWTASLAAAGRSTGMPENQMNELNGLVDEMYGEILKPAGRHLRYKGLQEAKKLQGLLAGEAVAVPEKLAITDLLNAAWRVRLRPGADAAALNQRFIDICKKAFGNSMEGQ